MNIFVTGASGFIGGNLVEALIKKKHNVTILQRSLKKKLKFSKKIKVVKGDIRNKEDLLKATKNIDIVFHLAAALPHHKLKDEEYWSTNVLGVENLIDSCIKNKVKKLVHVSTVGVYGTKKTTISEKSKINPTDTYSKTKHEGDRLVFKALSDGLRAVIIRPTIGYGPKDLRPGFKDLFIYSQKGLFLPVGNGENYLHTVYVGNLIQGMLLALRSSRAVGEDFIIGDKPAHKMKEIIRIIYKVQDKTPPPIYIPKTLAYTGAALFEVASRFNLPVPLNRRRVKFITDNRKYSIRKAERILKYNPAFSLEKGMKITHDWYQSQKII